MTECRFCGNETVEGALFCDEDCRTALQEMIRTAPYLFLDEGLPPGEEARRRELFRRARKGQKKALAALKAQYGVTAIWNGKRLISL